VQNNRDLDIFVIFYVVPKLKHIMKTVQPTPLL